MNRIKRLVFGSKQSLPKQSAVQTVKNTKITIEESIRRYEQLCAK